MLARIVSGGQTGADRGGLDAAIELALSHGGFCPRGRRAEDGVIPAQYQLTETDSRDYPVRTALNVVHSDATLAITDGPLTGGTALTVAIARQKRRPLMHVNLASAHNPEPEIRGWIATNRIEVLNVAGPRESSCPGIAARVQALLIAVVRG